MTRRDLWYAFCRKLGETFGEVPDLTKAYMEGKLLEPQARVQKTLAEAGNAAAEKVVKEQEAEGKKQEALAKKIEIIKTIDAMEDGAGKEIAILQYLQDNPEIVAQLDKLKQMREQLSWEHGTVITSAEVSGRIEAE